MMTGREKIEKALSPGGTSEVAAVICYEGIYLRDHWEHITSAPWWHMYVPDVEIQCEWRRHFAEKTGQDWFGLPDFFTRDYQEKVSIAVEDGRAFRVDARDGSKE